MTDAEKAEHPPTFGQKAVGISFNPSGNQDVDTIKRLYAQAIDLLNDARNAPNITGGRARHLSTAITDAETAQMRAVKALTWED